MKEFVLYGFMVAVVCVVNVLMLAVTHFIVDPSDSSAYHKLDVLTEEELTDAETNAIAQLKKVFVDPRFAKFTDLDWLRLAWCKNLDVEMAIETVRSQLKYTSQCNLHDIELTTVRDHIRASQLPVLAGTDLKGCPILWQRMQYLDPNDELFVGVKSAWLAADAALSDMVSIRKGLCLVYDFTGAGLQNVSAKLLDMTNGPLAASAAHPGHIARILFVNMPWMLGMAYSMVKVGLPKDVQNTVEMVYTNGEEWYKDICAKSELPEFLGGGGRGD